MNRRMGAVGLTIGMTLAVAAPAFAQDSSPAAGGWTTIVEGLNAPRGLAWGPDGSLYVAEAGAGGDQCMDTPRGEACVGMTGSISVIKDGVATKVIEGLVSIASDQEIIGTADVSVGADGTIYFPTPLGGSDEFRAGLPEPVASQLGRIWKQSPDGSLSEVADLVAFEAANNPDQADTGTEIDSNPNAVLVTPDGNVLAVDAGGNDLLMIAPDGTITLGALFPETFVVAPPDPTASPAPDPNASPAMMPMQAVPTSVAIGPDGAAYVSQLTGFPFPVGGASIWRIEQGGEPTVYATGLTNVMDLAFAPDGTLWVVEFAHNGLLSGDITGALLSIPAGGGEATVVATDGLMAPGGVAVDAAGTVFVSNGSVMPGGGSIVTLAQ